MFERYAIFYTPPPGDFADFCASWLGWDNRQGRKCAHPQIADIDIEKLTQTPRKYGFHGTLKAPFRLAAGTTQDALATATEALAKTLPAFKLDGLVLKHQRGFLALRPRGNLGTLNQTAAQIVEALDRFRAPASASELARRRQAMLDTPALIKAYLRLGGFVGEGAFVDHAFNTTDVCLILDTARMNARQRRIYDGGRKS